MGISHRAIWNIDYSCFYNIDFFSYVLQEWWGCYIRFFHPLENGKKQKKNNQQMGKSQWTWIPVEYTQMSIKKSTD